MRLIITLLAIATLAVAQTPDALTDHQALEIREAQLTVARAIIAKYDAEKAGQKAIDDAQAALQAKVLALQKEANREGCGLTQDLKWQRPPAK